MEALLVPSSMSGFDLPKWERIKGPLSQVHSKRVADPPPFTSQTFMFGLNDSKGVSVLAEEGASFSIF
ncbi:hypothetical protein CDL15_Pgr015233 [Punica granatum]|uniref:Uncharacterized protein n=1 Tax=Punica granatum TaxID=22663 RepID=A0A218W019_PUNGR|nr:hypothetical protein CDL15_Pgr015233 [Punica granatum]